MRWRSPSLLHCEAKKGDLESSPLPWAQAKEQRAKVQVGHFALKCLGN